MRTFNRELDDVKKEAEALQAAMPGWSAIIMPNHYWAFKMKEDATGIELFVSLNEAPKKYKVSGSWPIDRNHRSYSPENEQNIGVGFQRGHQALADGIQKRLLPYVRQQWPLILEQIEKAHTNEDGQKACLKEFQELLGVQPSENFPNTVFGRQSCLHEIRPNHNGSRVTVKMSNCSVTTDFARKLVRFIQENYNDND